MKDIRQKLFAIFQAEHAEHLEQIRSLLALMTNAPEAQGKARLDEAFRRAHTLKGAARAVDLSVVEGLASGLESVFSRVREGSLLLDQQVAGVIDQVLDSSEDCVAAFREQRILPEPAALQAIARLLDKTDLSGPKPAEPLPPPADPAQPQIQIEMVRLPVEDLDRLVRSTVQIFTGSLRLEEVTGQLSKLALEIARMETECQDFRGAAAKPLRHLATIPAFSSITTYIECVERNLHSLGDFARTARLLQQGYAWNLRGASEELRRDVWNARMVPVEDLFEGFRKMVRDLARAGKKEIVFQLTGSGARADRAVLQALKAPVMHLLRNAISHGIETPGVRESKGKPAAGRLTLHVESERGRLVLEVDDDGKGVDFQNVARVAAARGIVPRAASGDFSMEELEEVIFRPGFSTSPAVNDLSGRGMGLSVVHEAVRRLQGDVHLRPKQGAGASVVLSVPLSVSTHHLLLVCAGKQTLGIPTHGIERLYRIKVEQVETMEGKPVVNLGGRQVPLYSLAHLLGIAEGAPVFEGGVLPVVLLRSGGRRAALLVDEFVAEQDALIQDLGFPCPPSGNITGGVLLGNGSVAIVLNPAGLVENCAQSGVAALMSAKPPAPAIVRRILVVDDSITARSLEKSILEANGYMVQVAVDGLEALQSCRAGKPDLIISDVQMPRLDGFGLLEALKADPNLSHIPVIIVSSLERAEDQQRGLVLGADAYVVKRKFDQQELLDTIRQIL